MKLRSLRRRDGASCHWCGVDLEFRHIDYPQIWKNHPELGWLPTLDHYVPKKEGGSNKISNLVLACDWCNQKRGHKTPNQFRQWLRRHTVPESRRRRRNL